MARAVTAGELTTLRKSGHFSELYAAILTPASVYTARLAAVPSSTDMVAVITFTSGVGTLADVLPDMTLYVGTTAGAFDLGMVRIRKTPIAGTFYISEQSKVNWQADAYLTVVRDFDLWVKHIHIDGVTPKMDYDVAYSDQHSNFNPVPVLGPNRFAKLVGGTVDVQLGSETGFSSWVFGSTISSYAWTIPDASAIDNAAIEKPIATFNTTGWHVCYCVVTAANGKTKRGVRWVYTWDDNNKPATVFNLRDWQEDIQDGGISFTLEMAAEAGLSTVRERALVGLFSVDHYGAYNDHQQVSVGAITGAENVRGIGRIAEESIQYDFEKGTVTFRVDGYQNWFKRIGAFPIGLEIETAPDAWTDMPALTVDRALWHLLEWRSTATTIMDIDLTDDVRLATELVSPAGNLWSQMGELSFNTILANSSVDMYGRYFAQIDPQITPTEDRATKIVNVMTLTKADVVSGINLRRGIVPETAMMNLSGINVDSDGRVSSFFSLAPGHIGYEYGTIEVVDRLLLTDQAQANTLAAMILAWRRNLYPEMTIVLAGNNNMISCIPNQFVVWQIDAADTPRGITVNQNFIPRSRSMNFDPETGYLSYELNVESEVFPVLSANGDIPNSGDSNPSNPPPPASFPPLPDFPVILPSEAVTGDPKKVIMHEVHVGLIYTENFHEASPTWITINNGLTAAQYKGIHHIVKTPSGGIYIFRREIDWTGGHGAPFIAYASAPGATFTIIEDVASITAKHGGTLQFVSAVGVNQINGKVMYIIGSNTDYAHVYIGEGTVFSEGATITGIHTGTGARFGNVSFGDGSWVFTGNNSSFNMGWWRISEDGLTLEASASRTPPYAHHIRVGTSGKLYHFGRIDVLTYSTDNCASFTDIVDAQFKQGVDQCIACDPTGNFLMLNWTASALKGKSSDAGATMTALPSLPYGGQYNFEYCKDAGVQSKWIAAKGVVRYSPDFGNTWQNKEGNIYSLVAVPNIDFVRYYG